MNKDVMHDINPAPRLLMGPGPINADPRVLRAMSAQLLGQFDPQFRQYMKEVSQLYRGVFKTENRWTLLINGTARPPIEAGPAPLIGPRARAPGGPRLADRAGRPRASAGIRALRPPEGRDRQALRRRGFPR